MSSVGTVSSNSTIASMLRGRLSGSTAQGGQVGTLVNKLMTGRQLTAVEEEVAASTGLGQAVGNLVNASMNAQNAVGTLPHIAADANMVVQTRNVIQAANKADQVYAQYNPAYAKVSNAYHASAVGKVSTSVEPTSEKIFNTAGDVATIAGLGLSAVALPGMAKQTATSFTKLTHLVHDPNATTAQRLDALGQTSSAAAGTIFSAQGVVMGVKGTTQILAKTKTFGSAVNWATNNKFLELATSPVGRVINFLLPVADGAVFIGDAVAEKDTLENPNATESQKIMSTLNLGLATLKVSFWLFPGVSALRTIYNVAGLAQLGLTLYNYRATIKNDAIKAAKGIGFAIMHPVQAAHDVGTWVHTAASWVGNAAKTAWTWTWSKVSHPVQTFDKLATGVSTWYKALTQKTETSVSQAFSYFGPSQPATTAPAAPAAAPVAQVAAASTVSAPAAPMAPAAPAAPLAPAMPAAPAAPVAPAPVAPAAATPVAPAPAPVVSTPTSASSLPLQVAGSAPSTTVSANSVTSNPSVQAAFQSAMAQINARVGQ